MMYNIRSGTIQGQMASHLMAIVMFALSLTVCEILTKQEKRQHFDLENEGQGQRVEEYDLRHLIRNFRNHIGDYFSES